MAKKKLTPVFEANITREEGYLYYINKEGNIACVPMARGGKKGGKKAKKVVATCKIKKEKGYLYYVGKDGNVYKARMVNAK